MGKFDDPYAPPSMVIVYIMVAMIIFLIFFLGFMMGRAF